MSVLRRLIPLALVAFAAAPAFAHDPPRGLNLLVDSREWDIVDQLVEILEIDRP